MTRRMNMEPASVARQLINFEDFAGKPCEVVILSNDVHGKIRKLHTTIINKTARRAGRCVLYFCRLLVLHLLTRKATHTVQNAEEVYDGSAIPPEKIGSMRRGYPQVTNAYFWTFSLSVSEEGRPEKSFAHPRKPVYAQNEKLRHAIKANLLEVKKAFSIDSAGNQRMQLKVMIQLWSEIFSVASQPEELRDTLQRIGVSVADSDFEKILPKLKVDKGGITFQKLMEVFVDHQGEGYLT
eukprot:754402-Hanusia_phi.AAC.7